MKEIDLQDILENTTDIAEKKVGFVAVIGRPNAGKSTFLNTFIGEKISITSQVPQTTRNKILAIYNAPEVQIVFIDTPWIHKSEKKINETINNTALSSLQDADLILYFIDSSRDAGEEEKYIYDILQTTTKPIFHVYTKSDLKARIAVPDTENTFYISSETEGGFDELKEAIKNVLPIGPTLFPDDFYTKQNLRFRISEIIREKIFYHTKQELPHSIYVWIEEIEDTPKLYKIAAYAYTESESQKYILIGKWWNVLTKIWKEARLELEQIFWKKVFLSLRIKVKKNWRKDEAFVKKLIN